MKVAKPLLVFSALLVSVMASTSRAQLEPLPQEPQSIEFIVDALGTSGVIIGDASDDDTRKAIIQYMHRPFRPFPQNPISGDAQSAQYSVDICFINPNLPVCPCSYAPDSEACLISRGGG